MKTFRLQVSPHVCSVDTETIVVRAKTRWQALRSFEDQIVDGAFVSIHEMEQQLTLGMEKKEDAKK